MTEVHIPTQLANWHSLKQRVEDGLNHPLFVLLILLDVPMQTYCIVHWNAHPRIELTTVADAEEQIVRVDFVHIFSAVLDKTWTSKGCEGELSLTEPNTE